MKKFILNISNMLLIIIASSCSSGDDNSAQMNQEDNENDEMQELSQITLTTNTELLIANNSSTATLSISFLDQNNTTMPISNFDIFDNGLSIGNNTSYKTSEIGSHELIIQAAGISSNSLIIEARENIQYNIIEIPIIFHIIHFGEAVGSGTNLTSAQINTALTNLNSDFSNSTAANPNSVNTSITFRLATLDENNVPLSEAGISRIDATSYDVGNSNGGPDIADNKLLGPNESFALGGDTYWNPRQYLNIWVYPDENNESTTTLPRNYKSNPLAGLENVPNDCECNPSPQFYQSCFINTANFLSPILSHEVGHAFGLLHVFSVTNCDTSDYCSDTYSYLVNNPAENCDDNLGIDTRDNFMDYVSSPTNFTYDQRSRMQHVFTYGLWFNELKDSQQ